MTNMEPKMSDAYNKIKEKVYPQRIWFITTKGSMNYDLNDEKSDWDYTCVVLPSLNDIIYGRKIKGCTIQVNEDNIALVQVIEMRAWVQKLYKANPTVLETLVTGDERTYVNPSLDSYWAYKLRFFQRNVNKIASENKETLLYHYAAMLKNYLESYERDKNPKAAAQIIRIKETMNCLNRGVDFSDAIRLNHNETMQTFIKEFKRGKRIVVPEELRNFVKANSSIVKNQENKDSKEAGLIMIQDLMIHRIEELLDYA